MQMTLDQTCTLAAVPLDARNNPTPVDGPCAWSVSNPQLGSLVVSDDGKSAVFKPLDVGVVSVLVVADADVSDQTKQITGTLEIVITPAMATSIRIDVTEIK